MLSVAIIKIIHLVIVLAILFSIFVPSCILKEYVLILLIFLLFQYATGYEKCGLTELEYLVLGEKNHKEGFIYRLIKPIIKVPENYFYDGIMFLHLLWVIILSYQLYTKCPKIRNLLETL